MRDSAAPRSDAALIVTQPYPDDLQEVGTPAGILHALGKPAAIILNNTPSRAHAVTMARGALVAFPMPTCPTAITHLMSHSGAQRGAWRAAADCGQPGGMAMLSSGGQDPHRGLIQSVATLTNHDPPRLPSPISCRYRFETVSVG